MIKQPATNMHISVPNVWDGNDGCKYTTMSSYDNKTQGEKQNSWYESNTSNVPVGLWFFKKKGFICTFFSHSPKKNILFSLSLRKMNICCIIKYLQRQITCNFKSWFKILYKLSSSVFFNLIQFSLIYITPNHNHSHLNAFYIVW